MTFSSRNKFVNKKKQEKNQIKNQISTPHLEGVKRQTIDVLFFTIFIEYMLRKRLANCCVSKTIIPYGDAWIPLTKAISFPHFQLF